MKPTLILVALLVTLVVLNGCGGGATVSPDPPRGPVVMIVKWINVTPSDLAAENPNYLGPDNLYFRVMVYKQISATNNSGVFSKSYIPLLTGTTLENCIIGEGSITGVSVIASRLGDHVIISDTKVLNIKDRLYITVSRNDDGFILDIDTE